MAQAEARSLHQGQTSVNQRDCFYFIAFNKEIHIRNTKYRTNLTEAKKIGSDDLSVRFFKL